MKRKEQFGFKALCEECGKDEATCFVFPPEETFCPHCFFWCDKCQNKTNPYWMGFEDFFGNDAGMIDWMAHIQEKTWFDHLDFFRMMKRLRKASKCFNKIGLPKGVK